jgi:hypothetical protein
MVHADVAVGWLGSGTLMSIFWTLKVIIANVVYANRPVQFDGSPVNYCWSLLGGITNRLNPLFSFRLCLVAIRDGTHVRVCPRTRASASLFLLSAAIGDIWLARPDGARPHA